MNDKTIGCISGHRMTPNPHAIGSMEAAVIMWCLKIMQPFLLSRYLYGVWFVEMASCFRLLYKYWLTVNFKGLKGCRMEYFKSEMRICQVHEFKFQRVSCWLSFVIWRFGLRSGCCSVDALQVRGIYAVTGGLEGRGCATVMGQAGFSASPIHTKQQPWMFDSVSSRISTAARTHVSYRVQRFAQRLNKKGYKFCNWRSHASYVAAFAPE